MFFLISLDNGECFKLHKGISSFGRSATNKCVIISPWISRLHAKLIIRQKNGKFYVYIKDLNSSNGTFVNENKVEYKRIKIGDKICFGEFEDDLKYSYMFASKSYLFAKQCERQPPVQKINFSLYFLNNLQCAFKSTYRSQQQCVRRHKVPRLLR